MKKIFIPALLVASSMLVGCQSAYYNAMEKVGYHKRDIMIERIESAQDAQADAKEQFASALEEYQALITIEDRSLEQQYKALNREYEHSKEAAEAVTDRIESVESVSEALFKEWQEELELYSNAELKAQSAAKMRDTKVKYQGLMSAMRRAESSMTPVLSKMQDQVLFLKHNLNAQAIASLKGELVAIEANVAKLIDEMETSIAESQEFINDLKDS